MSNQGPKLTTGSTLAAWLIIAAILGFAGGGFIGVQTSSDASAGPNNPADTDPPEDNETDQPPDSENTPDEPTEPSTGISITASSQQVSSTDQVIFTGSLTPAEGSVNLVLWRIVDGDWTIFPNADNPIEPFVTDDDGNYEDYVQNLRTGDNTFKLVHEDDPSIESEEITVNVTE